MIKEPMLALLNHNKEFEVNTNAFDCTIEGILMQDKHLIAFESRKLNNTKVHYTVQEKKMTIIVHCLHL